MSGSKAIGELNSTAFGEPACPACGYERMELFYEALSVPSNSCILMRTPDEARSCPRGDIRLAFCPDCGFISNISFDQRLTEYSDRYEETQGFSGTFDAFHRELAQRLVDEYDLHGKDVIEIGCGKGEFITLLSELGGNRGIGFDPGYHEERNVSAAAERVTFVKDFYSEKYAHKAADFICCKMTLEHIHNPAEMVGTVRRSIGDRRDTIVFFQIPEVTRILRDCAFEDIYYEHCSYFSPGSLARLFRACGFWVLSLEKEYGGQYLTIHAVPDAKEESDGLLPEERDLETLRNLVSAFPERCREKLAVWQERLDEYRRLGKKVVLWGSGSKAVAFLTTLQTEGLVQKVVDINPYRQGYCMPATGQQIVGPSALVEYRPDVVVVMNRIYTEEISRDLADLGLAPEVVAL